MSKVLLALEICRRADVSLHGKRIFDYGFGAGTFFRHCPKTADLAGVEMDAENILATQQMLHSRGFDRVDLRPIEVAHWFEHPLLDQPHDVILCSHVLEHLPAPTQFLRLAGRCIDHGGKLVGIVPINERKPDLHHFRKITRECVEAWASATGLRVMYYMETDHFLFWPQPWLIHEEGPLHIAGRAVSLALGIPATLAGPRAWFALSRVFGTLTRSLPTQAAFVLEPA